MRGLLSAEAPWGRGALPGTRTRFARLIGRGPGSGPGRSGARCPHSFFVRARGEGAVPGSFLPGTHDAAGPRSRHPRPAAERSRERGHGSGHCASTTSSPHGSSECCRDNPAGRSGSGRTNYRRNARPHSCPSRQGGRLCMRCAPGGFFVRARPCPGGRGLSGRGSVWCRPPVRTRMALISSHLHAHFQCSLAAVSCPPAGVTWCLHCQCRS